MSTRSHVLALVLAALLGSGCASGSAVSTEPVSGFCESGTSGLGASWSREHGELVVVVRPTPGALGSRVPKAGVVEVNGHRVAFERGRNGGELVARVPYAGGARDLKIALYACDAAGERVLDYTNQLSPEQRKAFDAWLRAVEHDTRRSIGLP